MRMTRGVMTIGVSPLDVLQSSFDRLSPPVSTVLVEETLYEGLSIRPWTISTRELGLEPLGFESPATLEFLETL